MTLISLTDCCRLLAIDPKTFRRWLTQAQLSLHPHPADARIKGVSHDHLLQVAAAHRRTLAEWETDQPLEPSKSRLERARETAPRPQPPEASIDLLQVLTDLSAQMAAVQQQLAVLTQQVQHHPLQAQAASHPQELALGEPEPVLTSPAVIPPTSGKRGAVAEKRPTDRPRQPAQVLPLVEYGAQGDYVVICPKQGILSFQPDSPQWFAWLATLSSFRFVGRQGRLTAHRESQRLPRAVWRAHRKIRNHTYNHPLGQTECLTISVLEQAAAALQAHLK